MVAETFKLMRTRRQWHLRRTQFPPTAMRTGKLPKQKTPLPKKLEEAESEGGAALSLAKLDHPVDRLFGQTSHRRTESTVSACAYLSAFLPKFGSHEVLS